MRIIRTKVEPKRSISSFAFKAHKPNIKHQRKNICFKQTAPFTHAPYSDTDWEKKQKHSKPE